MRITGQTVTPPPLNTYILTLGFVYSRTETPALEEGLFQLYSQVHSPTALLGLPRSIWGAKENNKNPLRAFAKTLEWSHGSLELVN